MCHSQWAMKKCFPIEGKHFLWSHQDGQSARGADCIYNSVLSIVNFYSQISGFIILSLSSIN